MNEITFTGIKNIGALNIISGIRAKDHIIPMEGKYIIANLTNDYNGKDLDEYKTAKKACGSALDGYIYKHDPNFIHISTQKVYGSNDIPKLYLNMKEVPVKRETMPIFSYVAKLLKEISNMDKSDIHNALDFKYGDGGDLYILVDDKISNITKDKEEYFTVVENAFDPDNTTSMAKSINNDLQKQMEDYFA